jgi:hypothetical protein
LLLYLCGKLLAYRKDVGSNAEEALITTTLNAAGHARSKNRARRLDDPDFAACAAGISSQLEIRFYD